MPRKIVILCQLLALAGLHLAAPALPRVSPGRNVAWVPLERYPPAAIAARMEGVPEVTLTQGPDGIVTGCSLLRSSGHRPLDEASCPLAVGARLGRSDGPRLKLYWHLLDEPPTGSNGGAIPITPNQWIVTNDYFSVPTLLQGRRGTVRLSYDVTAEGRIANCVAVSADGGEELARDICELVSERANFLTAVRTGGPVATRGSMTINFVNRRR